MRVFPGWKIPAYSDFPPCIPRGIREQVRADRQINGWCGTRERHNPDRSGADRKRLNPVVFLAFPLNMLTILKGRQRSNGAKHADISHAPGIANGVQRIPVPHGITDTHAGQSVRFGNERVMKTF